MASVPRAAAYATGRSSAQNYAAFLECLSDWTIQRLKETPAKVEGKKRTSKRTLKTTSNFEQADLELEKDDRSGGDDAKELGEFIEYLASDIFPSFPASLKNLDYAAINDDQVLSATYEAPIPAAIIDQISAQVPPSTIDSLVAYGLLSDLSDLHKSFLGPLVATYITMVTTPPPSVAFTTRSDACDICERDWIPLTYHHLIPKQVHSKVLKRGWHAEWRLDSVAWLCRACHSLVHRILSNEELARNYYTVDLLLEREDVIAFAAWVGKVRWKSR